jgi:hypothetical protein
LSKTRLPTLSTWALTVIFLFNHWLLFYIIANQILIHNFIGNSLDNLFYSGPRSVLIGLVAALCLTGVSLFSSLKSRVLGYVFLVLNCILFLLVIYILYEVLSSNGCSNVYIPLIYENTKIGCGSGGHNNWSEWQSKIRIVQ